MKEITKNKAVFGILHTVELIHRKKLLSAFRLNVFHRINLMRESPQAPPYLINPPPSQPSVNTQSEMPVNSRRDMSHEQEREGTGESE